MSHKQARPLLFLILLTQDGLHPTMRSQKEALSSNWPLKR